MSEAKSYYSYHMARKEWATPEQFKRSLYFFMHGRNKKNTLGLDLKPIGGFYVCAMYFTDAVELTVSLKRTGFLLADAWLDRQDSYVMMRKPWKYVTQPALETIVNRMIEHVLDKGMVKKP